MLFNTKYNNAEKFVPKVRDTPIENQQKYNSNVLSQEKQYISANVQKALFRLKNRSVFDEKMDPVEPEDGKYQIGKLI